MSSSGKAQEDGDPAGEYNASNVSADGAPAMGLDGEGDAEDESAEGAGDTNPLLQEDTGGAGGENGGEDDGGPKAGGAAPDGGPVAGSS